MGNPQEHRGLVPSLVLAESTTTHSHLQLAFEQIHRSPACMVKACTPRSATEFLHIPRPSVFSGVFAALANGRQNRRHLAHGSSLPAAKSHLRKNEFMLRMRSR